MFKLTGQVSADRHFNRFSRTYSVFVSFWIILEIKFAWPKSHFLEWRRVETVDRVFNYITFVLFYGKPIYVQTIFIIFTSKHEFLVHLWIIKMSHFLTIEFPEMNFAANFGGMLFLLFRKGSLIGSSDRRCLSCRVLMNQFKFFHPRNDFLNNLYDGFETFERNEGFQTLLTWNIPKADC